MRWVATIVPSGSILARLYVVGLKGLRSQHSCLGCRVAGIAEQNPEAAVGMTWRDFGGQNELVTL